MNDLLTNATTAFAALHRNDPKSVEVDGTAVPWSVLYHQRLAAWIDRLAPNASLALKLAAQCQHVERWTLPRTEFPEGLAGYKRWRATLARFHAKRAAEVLEPLGADPVTVDAVQGLLLKKSLRTDPEVQLFEDAICLTFLENQLDDFATKHPDAKVIDIVQKTWRKMSPAGHGAALALAELLPERQRSLLRRALK